MKVSEQDINAAMELLAEYYPDDKFDIWCKSGGEYTAYLHESSKMSAHSNCAWGKTAVEAAQNLIKEEGARNVDVLRQKRLAALRDEVAKLEAEYKAGEKSVQA